MRVGIDVSQAQYRGGVSSLLTRLVRELVEEDKENEYVLFFSSLRNSFPYEKFNFPSGKNAEIKQFRLPQSLLRFIWNKLHIIPIETFLGDLDVFITSDWTEPPARHAKKITILYDLVVYKTPDEMDKTVINAQKEKLKWVKKESKMIICISESTKKDAEKILGIERTRLRVIYPGTF